MQSVSSLSEAQLEHNLGLDLGGEYLDANHPVSALKALFADSACVTKERMASVYAEAVTFRDPVNEIVGRAALIAHTLKIYKNLKFCRFDYLGETIGDNQACIRWDMYFSHPHLKRGRELSIRGMSYIEWDEKITYHEDVFDVGSMFYENVPILGKIIVALKRRLGAN